MSEVVIKGLGRPYNILPLPSWLKEATARDTEVRDYGDYVQVHALVTEEAVGIALGKLEQFKNVAIGPLRWTVAIDTSTRTLVAEGMDRPGTLYNLRVSKISYWEPESAATQYTARLVAQLLKPAGKLRPRKVACLARQLATLRRMSSQLQEIKWKQ